jgi:tol-pal system protein YbgF
VTEKLPVRPLPGAEAARRVARGEVVPRRAYEAALALYRSGKMSAAAKSFRRFIARHAGHAYADNALYWLGECFYDMEDYRQALKMFRRVVEEYPDGHKAPDALLKMGYSYLKLNETGNARTILAQLVGSYPDSRVARLASQTLVKIQ